MPPGNRNLTRLGFQPDYGSEFQGLHRIWIRKCKNYAGILLGISDYAPDCVSEFEGLYRIWVGKLMKIGIGLGIVDYTSE